ncbi:MAG: SDR family oxidoreductase [Rhodocyclaceae bacterium]|jgi:NAD(P)-dependent dehydrogenase (short-subunit alcohol dehydrogenase family)|nr:SDR family oxidoreductase [Rhodocyclaceae bacterium]MCE2723454.1 SDR family oxidoreductase [Betaproteobacteria bacterium]MCA3019902.1 SDR family oxidoreductase [Rhodocyclaceae bacterium]MCA3022419.1 SDR family oxidoreductase [Rhodocyclaceae bacterium]MCA3026794.1 SDR family oxidoreductase [Rhodocyclaceae bacterium]
MAQYAELKGKVALVTGAGRRKGLGEAIARRLASEGCKVIVTDIGHAKGKEMPESAVGSQSEMEHVAADIHAAATAAGNGGACSALALDVLEESQVKEVIATTVARHSSLDILVNNAGIGYLMKPIVEMSIEEWDAVLGVNLRGAFLCTKYAAMQMIKQNGGGRAGGRIVNIASQAAKSGFPFASAYCSSKHGLTGLTRVTAIEMGKYGITANAICPNHVTTGLGAWQNEYFSEALGLTMEQYMNAMKSRIPLGRPGLPTDTAAACAWLCSDEAQYVTGESMNVSGGEEYH